MANTKIPSELIPDDAITAAHIDSNASMTFAGVTSNKDAINVQMQSSTGTSQIYQKFINDGGNSFIGLASSTGSGLLSNAGNYSLNIQTESARNIALGTNNTLRMLIDGTTGNVGIGTASPSTAKVVISHAATEIGLHTTGAYNYQAKFESTDAEAGIVLADSNSTGNYNRIGVITNDMAFTTNNSERMRIDSTGRLGLGTASPSVGFFEVAKTYDGRVGYFNQVGSGGSNHGVMIDCASTSGWAFQTRTSGNTQLGVTGSVVYVNAQLGVGTSSPHSSRLLELKTSTNHYYPYQHVTGSSTYYMGFGNSSYHHHFQSGGSTGFYWGSAGYFNGGAHTYSDERLKENITTIDGALDKVALMNGVTFDWIDQDLRGSGKQFGVTAQNMLEVDAELPKLVEDAEASQEDIDNEELDTQYYAMDYARLTPFFIEAIKELKTKLEAAEARITELEG